jgi:hypothetical protein
MGSRDDLRRLVHLQADEQGSNCRLAKEAVCSRLLSGVSLTLSMEAKAKGLSEDTVMAEIGGHKEFQEQELEDARSPILRNPASYQNPYDIGCVFKPRSVMGADSRYQSRDNMSFYTVDAPVNNASHGDLGYGGPSQSTELFPMARPSGQTINLNRQPTSASTYNLTPRQGDLNVDFPVPVPQGGGPPLSASSYSTARSQEGQVASPFPSAVGLAK